ncbi:MAG: hypothetical protein CME24_06400 [Gemmatimonadetes bacterium]|nr:hypothetical protein [Gemmatimonadota bacterium]
MHEGVLYFGCDDGTVTALDVSAQRAHWVFETGGRVRSSVAIDDDMVMFTSDDGFLYAVNRQDGDQRWRFDLGSGAVERVDPALGPPYAYDYQQSAPAIVNDVVYAGSADGHLYAVERQSGVQRWRVSTDGKIRSTQRRGPPCGPMSSRTGRGSNHHPSSLLTLRSSAHPMP